MLCCLRVFFRMNNPDSEAAAKIKIKVIRIGAVCVKNHDYGFRIMS